MVSPGAKTFDGFLQRAGSNFAYYNWLAAGGEGPPSPTIPNCSPSFLCGTTVGTVIRDRWEVTAVLRNHDGKPRVHLRCQRCGAEGKNIQLSKVRNNGRRCNCTDNLVVTGKPPTGNPAMQLVKYPVGALVATQWTIVARYPNGDEDVLVDVACATCGSELYRKNLYSVVRGRSRCFVCNPRKRS